MNETMRNLFELQTLEFDETIQSKTETRIVSLRAKIPKSVLAHYDRLGDSGKKGVALLLHQVCTGCHLSVPLHVVMELKHGEAVRLCENCRRYLYLQEEPADVVPALPKTTAKPHRKHLTHAHEH
jgi:predicted  nucleic acid-binding Zn-ribbon protein